jgi:hypothetical protein
LNIDFAFICDYANAAGKLCAIGIGFDTIFTPVVPYRHTHFSVVLQLRASQEEAGQKKIQINLIDDDGMEVIKPIDGNFGIPKSEGPAPSIGRFVMEFGSVEFNKYGNYCVRIRIEDTEAASLYFRVATPPEGSTQTNPDVKLTTNS